MALEMVNRRIRFVWNNGGQTQTIEYPRRLKTNNEQLMKDQHWYIIDAERYDVMKDDKLDVMGD